MSDESQFAMLNRIFVYGSLRRVYTNQYARLLHQSANYMGKARMRGRKFQIGRYPGMKPPATNNDWVEGEVYEITAPANLFKQFDYYESPDYQREIRPATLSTGRPVDCWVYLYVPEVVEKDAQPQRKGPDTVEHQQIARRFNATRKYSA